MITELKAKLPLQINFKKYKDVSHLGLSQIDI